MSRKANSTVNLVKRRDLSGILKKQLNGNTSALGLGNEGLVEMERHNKIAQRSAPKGLLLKQRKLFIAAKTNNFNIILSSGFNYFESDVNIKDDKGNTPLYYAAKNGDNKICDFLIRHKSFVNEPCSEGNTPLHMAFASGQIMVRI